MKLENHWQALENLESGLYRVANDCQCHIAVTVAAFGGGQCLVILHANENWQINKVYIKLNSINISAKSSDPQGFQPLRLASRYCNHCRGIQDDHRSVLCPSECNKLGIAVWQAHEEPMSSLIPNFGVAVQSHVHVQRGKVDQNMFLKTCFCTSHYWRKLFAYVRTINCSHLIFFKPELPSHKGPNTCRCSGIG
jgi:hypothetical protein